MPNPYNQAPERAPLNEPSAPIDRRWLLSAGLIGAAAAAGRVSAGSLTPPGAPAPTMLSLSSLSSIITSEHSNTRRQAGLNIYLLTSSDNPRYTILAGGSWYISGDFNFITDIVMVQFGVAGEKSPSTLDFRGHGVWCNPAQGAVGTCVRVTGDVAVVVKNGNFTGIRNGVVVAGAGRVVMDNINCTDLNPVDGTGATLGDNAVIRNCTFDAAGRIGATVGDNCIIENCTFVGHDLHGLVTGSNCIIRDCVFANNPGNGLTTGVNCRVSGCTFRSNGAYGVYAGEQCIVEHCAANANRYGIRVGNTSICRKNLVDFHQTQGGRAIELQGNCIVEDNSVTRSYDAFHCTGTGNVGRRNSISTWVNILVGPSPNYFPATSRGSLSTIMIPDQNIIP
jgi:hypothetical protein